MRYKLFYVAVDFLLIAVAAAVLITTVKVIT